MESNTVICDKYNNDDVIIYSNVSNQQQNILFIAQDVENENENENFKENIIIHIDMIENDNCDYKNDIYLDNNIFSPCVTFCNIL